MKIVVIGGTGLIGRQVITNLLRLGHDAVPASPVSGVNTLTGEGLPAALHGAQAVIDVSNSPSFEEAAVLAFFQTSGRNLVQAEAEAGVGHHVALSVVGTDRAHAPAYLRAKLAQEQLIAAASVPYTIIRATQFFEFMGAIADAGTKGGLVRLSPAAMQPIASRDVAQALAEVVLAKPVNGIVEIAGPERAPFAEFVGTWLGHRDDPRRIVVDPAAPYFGIPITDATLTPGANARIMPTRFDAWLTASSSNGRSA
ncbi:NmrA family transcriptional regulator [Methylobacterium sp. P1-11]|uniref:SDR family oxidoreductase n=1 Tax=Methylobacterium sp. P1-11 TaxID=2024616 RepID=UPI0011F00137|nr:NAD(P)H-binding protein [Methylobacterium sp. P1-11]KAA0121982.1 NmrA family transcriptional regulator [Methylobacterium sp. P1-11]